MNVVRLATCLAAALVLAACSSGSSSVPSASPSAAASLEATPTPVASATASAKAATPAPSAAPSASAATEPTTFVSTTYGYSLTVPAGWTATPASEPWDGTNSPNFAAVANDRFVGPAKASAAGLAGPTTKKLADFVKERIAANAAEHSDTCPAVPEIQDPIKIGGEPGTLLAWNCGILINIAVTVHDGVGYMFGMRDVNVHAATDPTDRATLLAMLKSVHFPE